MGSDEQSKQSTDIVRDEAGRFPKGRSGNPAGRPKGSKNRVTLMKLMAEEAVRDNHYDNMLAVAKLVIEQALEGDKDSQKLVWQSVMSKGTADDKSQGKETLRIQINAPSSSSREEKGITIDQQQEDIEDGTSEPIE